MQNALLLEKLKRGVEAEQICRYRAPPRPYCCPYPSPYRTHSPEPAVFFALVPARVPAPPRRSMDQWLSAMAA